MRIFFFFLRENEGRDRLETNLSENLMRSSLLIQLILFKGIIESDHENSSSTKLFYSFRNCGRERPLGNYHDDDPSIEFSLIFTRASFLRGEKEFFLRGVGRFFSGVEPVMTVIKR